MLAALCGNSIFGFSFMFSRVALGVATPFVMLMYRFAIAFAAIHIVVLCARRFAPQGEGMHWLRFSLRGRRLWPLVLLGIVQPVAYFLCESYGISLTNSVFSGVIISLVPIASLAMGAIFLHEIPRRAQVGFSALSIAGVIIITLQQSAEGAIRPLGVVQLIGAVLTGVTFNLIIRSIAGEYSALERTYVMMLIAVVAFTALAVWECRANPAALLAPLASVPFMASILYLSLLSSITAFLVLNYAGGELPVAMTTAFCNLTTMISVLAGVVFLGEQFTLVSLAACMMIIAGVWGVQRTGA